MVVGDRHPLKAGQGFRGEDFLLRPVDRNEIGGDPSTHYVHWAAARFLLKTSTLARFPGARNLGMTRRRADPREAEFLRQIILGAGTGDRNIQAEQVAFRLPAGDVFGKAGSVIMQM